MTRFIVAAALAAIVVAALGAYWWGSPKGPGLSDVEHLRTPRIVTLPPQKVLVVTATGDPDAVGGEAIGLLMSTYFRLDGVPKSGPDVPAPRARWPLGSDTPRDQWVGVYAMPVPETVTALPDGVSKGDLTVELTTWEYGEVAEVLHVGPYETEESTVSGLHDFIARGGYEIAGDHEEEYLRGPGAWFAGDPAAYLTLIRYAVRLP